MEKTKYNDNKLAEEFDLIMLINDRHEKSGLPSGSMGTLTYSYTGMGRPLYAEFAMADGTRFEEPLAVNDFRVLNERTQSDLSLIAHYLQNRKPLLP